MRTFLTAGLVASVAFAAVFTLAIMRGFDTKPFIPVHMGAAR